MWKYLFVMALAGLFVYHHSDIAALIVLVAGFFLALMREE